MQVADRAIEVRELDVPEPPSGGALLRIEGCGMCGSDVEQFDGMTRRIGLHDYPVVPGHEVVGRIAALGDEARDRLGVDVGSRVAVHGTRPCGTCDGCRAGRACRNQFSYGFRSASVGSGLWGGYAEYMVLAPNTVLVPMADDLPVEDAVLFNPIGAGFDWAIRAAGTRHGDTLLVLGCGQRGLACLLAALEQGAGQVVVTGLPRDRAKLGLALELGATAALVVGEDDVVARVKALTGGAGADRVVDTTPIATDPVLDALAAARAGATIVLAGLKDGHTIAEFPVDRIVQRRLHLVGVLGASAWGVERAVELINARRYPLERLHTHTVGLDGVERAIGLLVGEIDDDPPALHVTVVP
jgi:threonine dehydrogenase-like Zn-dependent dehydrogenase